MTAHLDLNVHPGLTKYTSYCLYKLGFRARVLMDEALSRFGIIAPQMGMLRVLSESGSMNQMKLGRAMGIDKATMVKLVDGLEKLGYLSRAASARDRRERIIAISKKGMTALSRMTKARERVEKRIFSPLSARELAALLQLISKLFK